MSSKNAEYESSMLCDFGADEEFTVFDAPTDLEGVGMGAMVTVDSCGFGFVFWVTLSLLTRTDAGTIAVSSGVCCANGLFTTVEAADFTYDGLGGAKCLPTACSSS